VIIFIPEDAFAASFDENGNVRVEFANPTAIPTVVAEFIVNDEYFKAVYHDLYDIWEIFGNCDKWIVADHSHKFYEYAERTVGKCKDKLLSGPCPRSIQNRLTNLMVKEMLIEIDTDILTQFSAVPRKLKPRWTIDDSSLIVKSRLFNTSASDATATY